MATPTPAKPKRSRARKTGSPPADSVSVSTSSTTSSASSSASSQASPHFRVIVSDFRCWDGEHAWTFPLVKGLVLIHAPSGSGKSSILQAITWCLTGKTAANSVTWGKKKMTCKLEWSPNHPVLTNLVSIYRCNTPKTFRLTFTDGSKKESAEAEAWLCEQVHPKAGELAGLPQKLNGVFDHFLRMSQADKSLFLQQLLLGSGQEDSMTLVSKLREFCKKQTQESKSALDKANGSVESLTNTLSDMTLNASDPSPASVSTSDILTSETISSEVQRLEEKQVKWLRESSRRDQQKQAILRLSRAWETLDNYSKSRMGSWDDLNWNNIDDIRELLADFEAVCAEETQTVNAMEYSTAVQNEKLSRQAKLDEARIKLDEAVSAAKDPDNLPTKIQQDKAFIAEAQQLCSAHRQAESNLRANRDLYGTDKSLREKLEHIESQRVPTQCPACHSTIEFDMGSQQWLPGTCSASPSNPNDFDPKQFINFWTERDNVKKNWQSREKALELENETQAHVPDPKAVEAAKARVRENETKLDEYRTAKQNFERCKRELDECNSIKFLNKLPSVSRWALLPRDKALSEADRMSIADHRLGYSGYQKLCSRVKDLLLDVETSKPQNSGFEEVAEFTAEDAHALSRMKLLASNTKLTAQVEGWKSQLEQHKQTASDSRDTLEGAQLLEKMVRQAELKTVESHLHPVNSVLQQILDEVMFQDGNEMQCKFMVLSVDGKKPELAMDLYQRGQPCDEKSLSGGEYDRLALAITLTFYRLFASKLSLLCLDETLGALDSDKASEVLEVLHENANFYLPGLTLMVDHHGSKGHFDHVLELA